MRNPLVRGAALALAAVSLFVGAPVARADSTNPSEDARRDAGKALVQQGAQLYASKQYKDALAKFRSAYELFPNPKIFFNIGQSALQVGDEVGAANAFSAFLEGTLEANDIAGQRQTARQQLGVLTEHLARLRVEVTPPNALVKVDDQPIARNKTFVTPGDHVITATADGYQPGRTVLNVRPSVDREVPMRLEPVPAPVVKDVPKPEPKPEPVVEPKPAPTPVGGLQASTAPESAGRHTAGWVLAGSGGALVATSVVFGILASSANSTLTTMLGPPPPGGSGETDPDKIASQRSTVKTDAMISTVTLGVGVAAAAVGTYLLFTHDAPESQAAAPVASN